MAYINREISEKVRESLKAEFPEINFSVRQRMCCCHRRLGREMERSV